MPEGRSSCYLYLLTKPKRLQKVWERLVRFMAAHEQISQTRRQKRIVWLSLQFLNQVVLGHSWRLELGTIVELSSPGDHRNTFWIFRSSSCVDLKRP